MGPYCTIINIYADIIQYFQYNRINIVLEILIKLCSKIYEMAQKYSTIVENNIFIFVSEKYLTIHSTEVKCVTILILISHFPTTSQGVATRAIDIIS